jgi:hypothetical protein
MPQIELLTVANHAEAINGLLYLSGAGWTELYRTVPADGAIPPNHVGVGVAIQVGWGETNQRHQVALRIETADGAVVVQVQGEFELGRPPGLTPGSDLRSVLAFNGELQFPAAGIYRVVASVGDHMRFVTFRVHDRPALGIGAPAVG